MISKALPEPLNRKMELCTIPVCSASWRAGEFSTSFAIWICKKIFEKNNKTESGVHLVSMNSSSLLLLLSSMKAHLRHFLSCCSDKTAPEVCRRSFVRLLPGNGVWRLVSHICRKSYVIAKDVWTLRIEFSDCQCPACSTYRARSLGTWHFV
jgi:hypothetical protein